MEGVFYLVKDDYHKKMVLDFIGSMKTSKDNPQCISITEYKETRTQKQNKYLWGWVYSNIASMLNDSGQVIQCKDGKEMEWNKDLLHEAFKIFRSLPPVETKKGEIKMHESTASMDKKRFSEFLKDIEKACHSWWGICIPDPHGIWSQYLSDIL